MLNFVFWVFILFLTIQFIFYVLIFGKLSFSKTEKFVTQNNAISVIVCAKNEADNVKKFIPILANQNYPNFEIVLIDDASSDDTLEIFEEFEKKYTNIRLVKVANNEAFWGNKKFALTLGIKAAKNEYLLFTDANCYPTTPNWIAEMSACFTTEKTIVLGYSGFEKIEGSFLNKLIRFENVLMAIQFFAWAKIGKPFAGTGKNLAYKKSEFFKTNGFINHMKIRSGADKLFVNEAANKENTAFCLSNSSFTQSQAKINFRSWFTLKRHNDATAKNYKFFDKFQLNLFFQSQILVITSAIILLSWQFQWQIVAGLLLFRYLFVWITFGYAAKKFQEVQLVYWFPIIEIALLFVQLNVAISTLFSKPAQWK